MKKLKLNFDDLSVESFASGSRLPGLGTVRSHQEGEIVEDVDTGGESDYEACGTDYAATNRSRSTCPCNFSCLNNCSG